MSTTGWDDDPGARRWPGLPPLPGDRTADACVVGLGGSGLAAIAVALYRETLAELDRLTASLGPQVIRRVGSLRLAGLPGSGGDAAAERADCAAHAAALRAHGLAVEDYDGPLGHGIFLPDDAATNPVLRALSQAQQLSSRAALHEATPVRAVEPGRVRTAYGSVRAGIVIVAVDGGLELLVPELAGRVRTARLQMLATEAPPGARLPCPVYARWGYDYAHQTPGGALFVGGGRDRFAEAEWTAHVGTSSEVQGYLDGVAARFAGARVRVTHRWAANVGYTPDGRALCTELGPGLVAVGGYCGTGNLVGPVAARAAVALAVDATAVPRYFAD